MSDPKANPEVSPLSGLPNPMMDAVMRQRDRLKAAPMYDKASEAEKLFDMMAAIITDQGNVIRHVQGDVQRLAQQMETVLQGMAPPAGETPQAH